MKNLEQIRAANALAAKNSGKDFKGKSGGGSVAKKIPPLIINHGLLQFLAYANAEAGAERDISDCLAQHLSDLGIVQNCSNTDQLLTTLSQGDSQQLKQATTETMAWFNYARRFIA